MAWSGDGRRCGPACIARQVQVSCSVVRCAWLSETMTVFREDAESRRVAGDGAPRTPGAGPMEVPRLDSGSSIACRGPLPAHSSGHKSVVPCTKGLTEIAMRIGSRSADNENRAYNARRCTLGGANVAGRRAKRKWRQQANGGPAAQRENDVLRSLPWSASDERGSTQGRAA